MYFTSTETQKKFTVIKRIFETLKDEDLIFTPDGEQWQCDFDSAVERHIKARMTSTERTALSRLIVRNHYAIAEPDESAEYLRDIEKELNEFGLASIGDAEEALYSDNQKLFILDMVSQGVDIDPTYSGRGMFGKVCPSVRMDYEGEYLTGANVVVDSMGKRIVVYAQY